MKKSYLILLAAVCAFTACKNDDFLGTVKSETPAAEQQIAFSTFNNKMTKAENSTENTKISLLQHHADFSVWALKDNETAKWVFQGTKVEGKDDNGTITWEPVDVRFWDKTATRYDFYAAAPAAAAWKLNGATVASDHDKGYFTLADVALADVTLDSATYQESMKEQANIDYMIASDKYVEQAAFGQEVDLDFNHILSRLNVTVKRGPSLEKWAKDNSSKAEYAKVTLTSLQVVKMLSKGSFDESKVSGTDLQNGTTGRWTTTNDVINYTACITNATDLKNSPEVYVLQSLVMPQTVKYEAINAGTGKKAADATDAAETYVCVKFNIGTESYTTYVNLAAAFGAKEDDTATADIDESLIAFNEGWQNTLRITIDASAITFTANAYNWEDGADSNYTIETAINIPTNLDIVDNN